MSATDSGATLDARVRDVVLTVTSPRPIVTGVGVGFLVQFYDAVLDWRCGREAYSKCEAYSLAWYLDDEREPSPDGQANRFRYSVPVLTPGTHRMRVAIQPPGHAVPIAEATTTFVVRAPEELTPLELVLVREPRVLRAFGPDVEKLCQEATRLAADELVTPADKPEALLRWFDQNASLQAAERLRSYFLARVPATGHRDAIVRFGEAATGGPWSCPAVDKIYREAAGSLCPDKQPALLSMRQHGGCAMTGRGCASFYVCGEGTLAPGQCGKGARAPCRISARALKRLTAALHTTDMDELATVSRSSHARCRAPVDGVDTSLSFPRAGREFSSCVYAFSGEQPLWAAVLAIQEEERKMKRTTKAAGGTSPPRPRR